MRPQLIGEVMEVSGQKATQRGVPRPLLLPISPFRVVVGQVVGVQEPDVVDPIKELFGAARQLLLKDGHHSSRDPKLPKQLEDGSRSLELIRSVPNALQKLLA